MGIGVFDMVVITVVIGCLTGVLTSYFESKAKQAEHGGAGKEELETLKRRLSQSEGEMETLRQRVKVLEKLVTDDDRRLAEEINRLGPDPAGSRSV